MSRAPGTLAGLAHLTVGAPLDPSREQARDLAHRELSRSEYAEARPGVVQRLVSWLLDRLSRLDLPEGRSLSPSLAAAVLVAVLVLLAAVVLYRTGGLRRGTSRDAGTVLDDVRRGSGEHRRLAEAAAREGRFDVAVRERFRAVARSLEERTLLDERPGRTAAEVSAEAGALLPVQAGALRQGAHVFDDVCYGGRTATVAHAEQLRRLDEEVARARPMREGELATTSGAPA